MDYYIQNVRIPMDKDTELYKRVEAKAAKDGVPVENVIETLAVLGIAGHMEKNLESMERLEARKGEAQKK